MCHEGLSSVGYCFKDPRNNTDEPPVFSARAPGKSSCLGGKVWSSSQNPQCVCEEETQREKGWLAKGGDQP